MSSNPRLKAKEIRLVGAGSVFVGAELALEGPDSPLLLNAVT
jgi:hypothetical protein